MFVKDFIKYVFKGWEMKFLITFNRRKIVILLIFSKLYLSNRLALAC